MVYGSPGEAMDKRRFPWRALAAISLIVAVLSGIFFSTIWARWGPAETDIAGRSPALGAAPSYFNSDVLRLDCNELFEFGVELAS